MPENPLQKPGLRKGLSLLAKSADGFSHAFVRFELRGEYVCLCHDLSLSVSRGLTDISILDGFKFLRYVVRCVAADGDIPNNAAQDVSENQLLSLSVLGSMPELLYVKADSNQLTSAAIPSVCGSAL